MRLPLSIPTLDGHITSRFGHRPSLGDNHRGIDLAGAPAGAPVLAVLPGEVEHVDVAGTSNAGKWIRLGHGSGVQTRYLHLNDVHVRVGQNVEEGQEIGLMGYTGQVVPKGPGGAHLHFEVIISGQWVDPEPYLRGQLHVPTDRVQVILNGQLIAIGRLVGGETVLGDNKLRDLMPLVGYEVADWSDHPPTVVIRPARHLDADIVRLAQGHCESAAKILKGLLDR